MAIKIKREQLEKIVVEELARYLAEQLNEAAPGRGTVLDDPDQLPPEDEEGVPSPEMAPEEPLPGTSPVPDSGDQPGEVPDQEGGEDPSDDDLEAMEAGEEPPSEEQEGTIAGEISGKTIQKITVDEDSKIIPGATEVVISFIESPDALRLLVTKTGKVRFFYRGLHNTLDAIVAPMPGDDAPEEPDELGGDEELEDMPPLGDEDMPPEPAPEEELPPEEPV